MEQIFSIHLFRTKTLYFQGFLPVFDSMEQMVQM